MNTSHSSSKRIIFVSILLTIGLDFFNLGLIYPLFTSLIFEGSNLLIPADSSDFYKNALFGILNAAFPFGQFFGAPVIGHLSDYYGRRRLFVISLIGTVVTLLICGLAVFAGSLSLLLLGRLAGGLMAGNITVAYASLADLSTPEEKVRNFALIPLFAGAGFALGPYVAGILVNPELGSFASPAMPFLVGALFSLINLFLIIIKFPKSATQQGSQKLPQLFSGVSNLFKALANRSLQPYLWVLFAMISANFLYVQFIGPFSVEKFSLNVTEVGYLYAVIGASCAIGHLFITRRLAVYFTPEKALAGSLIFLSVFLILLAFSFNIPFMYAVSTLSMFACCVGYTNSMSIVSNCGDKDTQGMIMGVAVSIQSCAEFLPAAIVGFVASFSQALPLVIAALLALSALLVLQFCISRKHVNPMKQ